MDVSWFVHCVSEGKLWVEEHLVLLLNKMKTKQGDGCIRSCTNPSVSFSPLWVLMIAAALLEFSHQWEREQTEVKRSISYVRML